MAPDADVVPPGLDIALVRAANPGPLTLSGTNTWVLARDPCWVVDPGPLLDDHVAAVLAEAERRGGLGGVALTHDHLDHAAALDVLADHAAGPIVAARHPRATLRPADGELVGPLVVHVVRGHAPDHLCFGFGTACCTGDAVLGRGSVFIAPDPGALRDYLAALGALRERAYATLLPGHGPPVDDPAAWLDGYVAHRLERERALVNALGRGLRSVDDLLADVWADAPAVPRPAVRATLAAHLDKLAEEGRLPEGVERPTWDWG